MSTSKKVVSVRVPQDTHDGIIEYKDERKISRTDALRRIIEKGLEVEQGESERGARGETPTGTPELVHFWATVLGAFLAGVSLVLLPAWALTPYVPTLFLFTVALLTIVWNAGAYSYARRTGLTGVES